MREIDLCIGAIATLMLLAGIVLTLITVRDRSLMRKRWN